LSLPQIQISERLYSILKIVFLTSAFIVIVFNVLSAHALPQNSTDWNWGIVEHNGSSGYPDNYYDKNGYPTTECDCELVDDDLEEQEEIEDEQEHSEESKEYDNNNSNSKEEKD